ncbi:esterase family protein [Anaerotignum sp.]
MHTCYYKEYSHNLNRDMEFKVYGHAGLPMVVFPCQDGKFYDFEDRGMINTVADYLENGRLQLFCVGCVDEETWSATGGDYHGRILWHEQWFKYLCEEFMPRLHQIHGETDPTSYYGKVILTGASMGGYHCVNFYLRRPDLFGGCLSLSGLFHAGYFFPHYDDVDIYYNSPVDYLPQMPCDHPLLEQFRQGRIIICCGQGAWEDEAKADARIMQEQFHRLNVPAWVDLWGEDVNHDWPWWLIQFPYFVNKLLGY